MITIVLALFLIISSLVLYFNTNKPPPPAPKPQPAPPKPPAPKPPAPKPQPAPKPPAPKQPIQQPTQQKTTLSTSPLVADSLSPVKIVPTADATKAAEAKAAAAAQVIKEEAAKQAAKEAAAAKEAKAKAEAAQALLAQIAKAEAEAARAAALLNINWSNSNPDTWGTISNYINIYFWESMGRDWIRTYHFLHLVDWAKVLYDNPDNPNAQEIATIILTNEDRSLTQEQISAIESKFNLKQNSSAPPPAPPLPTPVKVVPINADWSMVNYDVIPTLKEWLKNSIPTSNIKQYVNGDLGRYRYVDWAYAAITTTPLLNISQPGPYADILLTNKDGTLSKDQLAQLRQVFGRYIN
jgi:hypothetical protein